MAFLAVDGKRLFWFVTFLACSKNSGGEENTTSPLRTIPPSVTCSPTEFECEKYPLCIPGIRYCDGWNDCIDGSDESHCPRPPTAQCSRLQFPCNDGHCIILRFRCNGFDDCPDGSDELNCPLNPRVCLNPLFRCENGRCVDKSFVCDGQDNCKDLSDETHCDFPSGSPQNSGPSSTSHLLYHDARYQAATYTIIGCTVAFIAVVVCFVITVHQIKRRQEAMRTPPRQRQDIARDYRRGMYPSQNQMPYFIQSGGYRRGSPNYLVTYNINNGVQIISSTGLVKPYDAPPKYDDIVGDLAEGSPDSPGSPPPPYSEVEQPLLMRLDTVDHQADGGESRDLQVLLVSGRRERDYTLTPGRSGEVVCQRTEEAVPMLGGERSCEDSTVDMGVSHGRDSTMAARCSGEPSSDQLENCRNETHS